MFFRVCLLTSFFLLYDNQFIRWSDCHTTDQETTPIRLAAKRQPGGSMPNTAWDMASRPSPVRSPLQGGVMFQGKCRVQRQHSEYANRCGHSQDVQTPTQGASRTRRQRGLHPRGKALMRLHRPQHHLPVTMGVHFTEHSVPSCLGITPSHERRPALSDDPRASSGGKEAKTNVVHISRGTKLSMPPLR